MRAGLDTKIVHRTCNIVVLRKLFQEQVLQEIVDTSVILSVLIILCVLVSRLFKIQQRMILSMSLGCCVCSKTWWE